MLNVSPPPPAALDAAPDERVTLATLAREFRLPLLQYFQRRIRDPHEAEDLVQETFVRLIKRGNIAALEGVRSYLFETASSVVVDHARRQRARLGDRHQAFDAALHGGADFSAEHVLIGQETQNRAVRALRELPARTRAVFVLRRMEGLRYQQIAGRLGVSLSLVEKEMARAVAHLAQRMEEA